MSLNADGGNPSQWRIGLVGYGEVGRILAEDLRKRGIAEVRAYDTKLGTAEGGVLREHAQRHGVILAESHTDLAQRSDFILSAVTARQAVPAAQACAPGVQPGSWYLDFNSASPGAKRTAAAAIESRGGRFVEGAVMTSVPPTRIRVPLLLGGPHAAELRAHLEALGFNPTVASGKLGVASATKMCRSIMIKGLEAMMIESLVTARAHGVEDDVIASLRETFPGIDWEKQASYCFQRVIQHGRRRSEEMAEAAETVRELGLEPWSAHGTTQRQAWMADLTQAGVFGDRDQARADWRLEADRILAAKARK